MNVGVLVLAAGRSARFGSDKRVARLPDGQRLIDTTVNNVRESGLPALVCLRAHEQRLAAELAAPGITCLQCRHADEGMGATLGEAVRSVVGWDGALIALADMPWLAPGTYRQVAAALTPDTIVQPHYRDAPGHPVGFGATFFPELAALTGDVGGRSLLGRNAQQVRRIDVADPAICRDVDRPGDMPAW